MKLTSDKILSVTSVSLLIVISLLMGVGSLFTSTAHAAQLQTRSLTLDNPKPGVYSKYVISFDTFTASTLGSIQVDFCGNTAIFGDTCFAPSGFDVSQAVIDSQTGVTGFIIDPSTTNNILVLSRAPAANAPGTLTITLSHVMTQSYTGSSFARYSTFASSDASGIATDQGSIAYSIQPDFEVSAEVPPYINFCVANEVVNNDCSNIIGNYVNLGNFSVNRASTGKTQMAVSTNAQSGYFIQVNGGTLTSGNNALPSLDLPTASAPGVNQFGINLRANTDPVSGSDPTGPGSGTATSDYGQQNRFKYVNNDIIADSSTSGDYRKFQVTYLVNINQQQPPGIYSSTFTYVAAGRF
jgi:hypothetical protein